MLNYMEILEEDINSEDIDVSSLRFNSELNPLLWDKVDGEYKLKDDVKKKLVDIADKFSEFIRYKGSKFDAADIIITGSNCNFNYTPTSDLDLHLLVNFDSISCDEELISQYLYDKKLLWSLKYDIRIKNIPVECYAGDAAAQKHIKGAAMYSLLQDAWIQKPDLKNIVIDMSAVKDKAAEIMELVKRSETIDQLEKLKDRLWRMRSSGLARRGEFSLENLTYKILRKNGTVDAINDKIRQLDTF